MKHFLGLTLVAMAILGCSSSASDEGAARPGDGVALNPGGKPKTAEEAAMASGLAQTGNAMNDQRAKDAAAMQAAKARAGGQ